MQQIWDQHGEAGAALARAVEGFGPQVLGRADMLSGLLEDDVPHLPREVALLTAAARSGTSARLTERVQQGLAADQAVLMAASEMASRTAMDASGSQWAVGEFARALGYAAQPATAVAPVPAAGRDASIQLPPATPTVRQATVPPERGPAPTAGDIGTQTPRRARAAAVAAGIAAVMAPFWLLEPFFSGGYRVSGGIESFMLLAGFSAAAVWVARRAGGGAGFAVVFGIAAAAASQAIFYAAAAVAYGGAKALELTMGLFVAATLIAAGIAVAGLARGHHLALRRATWPAAVTSAAGAGFALANILAQTTYSSTGVLGPGVRGWWIVWGVMFLVLVALPPFTGLFIPRPEVLSAMWYGWLIFGLAWQISDTPLNGDRADPGLYVTWILWLIVLVGTIVIARRRSAAQSSLLIHG